MATRRWGLIGIAVTGLLAVGVSAMARAAPTPLPATSVTSAAPRLVATWQFEMEPKAGGVLDPVDIAVTADGMVWVVDQALRRVLRFDGEGAVMGQYGRPGDGPGGLVQPFGLAVDTARQHVFVSDRSQGRLAVFDLGARFVGFWEDYNKPEAITIGPAGTVYVYNRGANTIVGRTPEGGRGVAISIPFSPTDLAVLPSGLATESTGRIWMATEPPVRGSGSVIWVYGPNGDVIPPRTQVRGWNPRDIAIDANNRIYILDGSGGRLVVDFDRSNGQFLAAPIGSDVRAIAVAATPSLVYLLNGPTGEREGGVTLVRFAAGAVQTVAQWRFPPIELGWLRNPVRVAVGGDGGVVVVDEVDRAQRFDAAGGFTRALRRLGMQLADATADGDWLVARTRSASSIDDPNDPDVAPQGRRRLRIERYRPGAAAGGGAPGGDATRLWSHDWTEAVDGAERSQLVALAHDPRAGLVYALDASQRRVLVLGLDDGRPNGAWSLADQGGGLALVDLDVGADGAVLVLNAQARKLLRLDAMGKVAGTVDMPAGAMRFAAASDGGFVVITTGREVQKIDADGRAAATWALPAPRYGDPEPPSDVAVDAKGRVYVTDRDGQAVYVFGVAGDERGPVYLPAAWANHE